MDQMKVDLRAVFYKEGEFWVAHCLEMDVMGHGKTQQKALNQLSEAMCLQIAVSLRAGNVANIFQPADARFFQMYFTGKSRANTSTADDGVSDQQFYDS